MLETEGQNDLSIYHRYKFPTLKYFNKKLLMIWGNEYSIILNKKVTDCKVVYRVSTQLWEEKNVQKETLFGV